MSPSSTLEARQSASSWNLQQLGDIIKDMQGMLETVTKQLMAATGSESPAMPADAELKNVCERLRITCDAIGPLVGTSCDSSVDAAPRLLVLGQPKSGKSSLINEMLGQTVLCQSESSHGFATKLARLRHSPEPPTPPPRTGCHANDDVITEENSTQSSPPPHVAEVTLSSELLQRSGIEILDSPGSQESPPVDAWVLADSPAVIVYVIDATTGITREVEEDIRQISFRFASSQLVFVLNKMDASAEAAAAAGVSRGEAEAAMRRRVLAGLQQLGCLTADEPLGQIFALSCRRLRAVRRRLRRGCGRDADDVSADADEGSWLESLRSLRSDIVCGITRRLQRLLAGAVNGMDEASRILEKLCVKLDDITEEKRQAWENILDLQGRAFRQFIGATSEALAERMTAEVRSRNPEILKAVQTMKEHSDEPQKSQAAAEAEIQRFVFDLQLRHCQEVADAELKNRLQPLDDILATLPSYQAVKHLQPTPLISRQFSVKEGLDFDKLVRGAPVKKEKSKSLFRSVGSTKSTWKIDTAKSFMKSVDLMATLRPSTDRLEALIRRARDDAQAAVGRANERVKNFRDELKTRGGCLSEHKRVALKLWLRLHSVLTQSQFRTFDWHRRVCIGVGAQGSVIYRVCEATADGTEGRAMAVKKIVLDDDEFGDMAAALKYNCSPKRDSVLRIENLQIKQLSSEPTLWKLHLWTELMPQRSLQQQLSHLCQQKSLTDRLSIGLSIASAIAQLHEDRQLHANLRMSNVFICNDGRSVKLSDLGQARTCRLRLPSRETVSLAEFPPELMLRRVGSASADGDEAATADSENSIGTADVYSLGVILRSLTGECEKPGSGFEAAEEINKIIENCTQQRPGDRPSSTDVAERLRRSLSAAR